MSSNKSFHLPDLGEGLPDATIVEWFVKVGDVIKLDEPLVSMETAKAVVEVPAPCSGTVLKLAGGPGDVINTGAVLAEFQIDPSLPQRADAQDTGHGHHHAPASQSAPAAEASASPANASASARSTSGNATPAAAETGSTAPAKAERADAGTVVGAMQVSDQVRSEAAVSVGGVRAMPAVRALAKKLGVDLSRVRATGPEGVVSMDDVKRAAAEGSAPASARSNAPASLPSPRGGGAGGEGPGLAPQSATAQVQPQPAATRTPLSASGRPMATRPPSSAAATGQPEQLKGVRRNMARVMAAAHAQVVPTTLTDDADIHAWTPGNDITVRLIRAIVRACKTVPALNAWFDGENLTRTLHPHVDIGIAVDTDDGLFVPALRNADVLDAAGIRQSVDRLRAQVMERSIPSSELSGYTISLSNFGMFAGKYATPVIVPPCVAILAAGRGRHQLVPVMGGIETHRIIPLSLTFDHRAATGGEAARFLRAVLDDLALPG
ncbi:dihydrolipoamide acetyltransferase family protein [uncultured Aquimonas sp.]|uniref:dihydrolipoamide acetyltransferase family protein n=1 Tax=uncultured Aquimonas sp. TaxID=385483 RepID=UPI00086B3A26|nr:dihydrolipoamide acetyltransferase family protein [uncultured Aquimonas sp.]ODU45129.1 MAG: branched-chain alpha-keto acid dehydrogenase subunit E2 [Xanthomonadaceae bacterium SCN 69-123]